MGAVGSVSSFPLPLLQTYYQSFPWDNLEVLRDSIMSHSPRKPSFSLKMQHKLDNLPNCQLVLQVIHEVNLSTSSFCTACGSM